MTSLRIKTAAIVYSMLAAVAVGWGIYRDNPNLYHHPDGLLGSDFPFWAGLLLGGATGVAFGLGVAWLTRFSVYRFNWAHQLHMEFRGLLGPLTGIEILSYASLAAIGEEMLFRGAMQPSLGIVLSSLIFGFAHVAWGRKSIPWPLQAIVMGFSFGGLYWISGTLIAPIMAHFTINYQNLHFVNSYDPSLQLPRSFSPDINRR